MIFQPTCRHRRSLTHSPEPSSSSRRCRRRRCHRQCAQRDQLIGPKVVNETANEISYRLDVSEKENDDDISARLAFAHKVESSPAIVSRPLSPMHPRIESETSSSTPTTAGAAIDVRLAG